MSPVEHVTFSYAVLHSLSMMSSPENGESLCVRNVDVSLQFYMALQPTRTPLAS
jgi:hypothetical protein